MASDQQFCLRWNNHQSTLVSVFDNLLESQTLVDCTLAADGQYLKAHKVVLSACSPYLEAILCQNLDKHPILILKDVKFSELKAMLDYMYRGEVNISQEQLSTFLKAAESLQIKGLTDSGGGGSNDRERDPLKRQDLRKPLIQPVPHIPQPRPVVPHPGLMERRSLPHFPPHIADMQPQSPRHAREGSTSPTARKRRRPNRPSSDDSNFISTPNSLSENQPDTSDSCDVPVKQATSSTPNVPNTTTKAPETDSNRTTPQPQNNQQNSEQKQQVTVKKEFSETLLTPKTEFDYGNDNSMEDVTYEDDEEEEVDLSKPGTSFAANSQGFPPWQMGGDGSNDDSNNMYSPDVTAATNQNNSQGCTLERTPIKRKNFCEKMIGAKDVLDQSTSKPFCFNQVDYSYDTSTQNTAWTDNTDGPLGLNSPMEGNIVHKIKIRSDLFHDQSSQTLANDCIKESNEILNVENGTEIKSELEEEITFEVTLNTAEVDNHPNITSIQVVPPQNEPETPVAANETIVCNITSLNTINKTGNQGKGDEGILQETFGFQSEDESEGEEISIKIQSENESGLKTEFEIKIEPDEVNIPLNDISLNTHQSSTSICKNTNFPLEKQTASKIVNINTKPKLKSVQNKTKVRKNVAREATNLENTLPPYRVPLPPYRNKRIFVKNYLELEPKTGEKKVDNKSNTINNNSKRGFLEIDSPTGPASIGYSDLIGKVTLRRKCNTKTTQGEDEVFPHLLSEIPCDLRPSKLCDKHSTQQVKKLKTSEQQVKKLKTSEQVKKFKTSKQVKKLKTSKQRVKKLKKSDNNDFEIPPESLLKNVKKIVSKEQIPLKCDYCMLHFYSISDLKQHCDLNHSSGNLFF